jgi:hypothetical protein
MFLSRVDFPTCLWPLSRTTRKLAEALSIAVRKVLSKSGAILSGMASSLQRLFASSQGNLESNSILSLKSEERKRSKAFTPLHGEKHSPMTTRVL